MIRANAFGRNLSLGFRRKEITQSGRQYFSGLIAKSLCSLRVLGRFLAGGTRLGQINHLEVMMELDRLVFYTLSLGISFANLITMCTLFYLLQSYTSYHRNLRVLLLILNEAFGCIALSNFLTACLNLGRENMDEYTTEENFLTSMSSYGMNLASVVFIALIVERTAATAFRKVYEQMKSFCALLIMIIICQLSALGMSFFFTVRNTNYYIQAIIVLSVDGISMLALMALYCMNSTLREIDFRSDITLTQRYQVNENIRAVYTLMPLIIVGVLFSMFGIAASAIQNVISAAFRLRLPIYNLMMNVYVCLAFVIAIRQDHRLRHGFFLLLHCGHEDQTAKVEPATTVKNVFGKSIINDNSTQQHFKSLNLAWH